MRIFRPSYQFSLPYKSRKIVGNATELTLRDCKIMIPTVWIKQRKVVKKQFFAIINEYWAEEIGTKIRVAGGNPKNYKSLQSCRH